MLIKGITPDICASDFYYQRLYIIVCDSLNMTIPNLNRTEHVLYDKKSWSKPVSQKAIFILKPEYTIGFLGFSTIMSTTYYLADYMPLKITCQELIVKHSNTP